MIATENVVVVPKCQQPVKTVFLNERVFKIDSGLVQNLKKIRGEVCIQASTNTVW